MVLPVAARERGDPIYNIYMGSPLFLDSSFTPYLFYQQQVKSVYSVSVRRIFEDTATSDINAVSEISTP